MADSASLKERLAVSFSTILSAEALAHITDLEQSRDQYAALYAERCGDLLKRDARIAVLEAGLLAVVSATRAYLPPDGISAEECISRVLAATDNPTITPIIKEIEHGRS